MGYYINEDSTGTNIELNKCAGIINDGGKEISQPTEFTEDLVCVVNNGFFEAAGYCYSPKEFEVFSDATDRRSKRWFIYPHAKTTSGYIKQKTA